MAVNTVRCDCFQNSQKKINDITAVKGYFCTFEQKYPFCGNRKRLTVATQGKVITPIWGCYIAKYTHRYLCFITKTMSKAAA